MNTLSVTTSLLTHSLAWALIYSLWQGLLIYGTLYALLKALPQINAQTKYYLSFSAFSALFLWFADTWFIQFQKLRGVAVYITKPVTDTGISATYAAKAINAEHIQSPSLYHFVPRIEQYFPLIIIIYCIGLSFMLFRFLMNLIQMSKLRKQGIIEPDRHWNDLVLQWQKQFDITRPIKLFLSNRISVPMMLGAIKPVILLPVATINHLTTEQVEAILLHELAHIKRHDYLFNIFQTIAETILFFNPFVWLLSAIIRREREHCCDDLVVSCSASPLPYAKALAILEDKRFNENNLLLAATGHRNQLFHRIKRIMEMKKSNINYNRFTIIIVAVIAIMFSVAMFTFAPSFAQKAKGDSSDTTVKKKTVYKYKYVTVDSNGNRTEIVKESSTPIKDELKNDDDNDANVNISVNDDKDSKKTKTSTYVYSYANNDGDDIKKTVDEIITSTRDAIGNIDMKEIDKELEKAQKEMKTVDWDKIGDHVNKAIADVNKELNDPKLHKEIDIKVKKELEDAKDELEHARKEIEKTKRVHVETYAHAGNGKPIATATNGDKEANTGKIDFESMLNKMEKEGLIDRSKNYKVETEDGKLYINGEKQPEAVYHKYSQYLKDKSVNIKGHNGSLSISVND